MEHILFMNDAPIAVVKGDDEYRREVLDAKMLEHYDAAGRRDFKGYRRSVYWHYRAVEVIHAK